jgi:hypothetical protein
MPVTLLPYRRATKRAGPPRKPEIEGPYPLNSARRLIHPSSLLSTSVCSQKIVSIERYIVVAMAALRLPLAGASVELAKTQEAM